MFRGTVTALVATLLLTTLFADELGTGTLCVAPLRDAAIAIFPEGPEPFCRVKGKATLRIDERQPVTWPNDKSLKIDGLDISRAHRVVIVCGGKPVQSFRFSFSEHKEKQLCLFINDFYGWADVWEPGRVRRCRCK